MKSHLNYHFLALTIFLSISGVLFLATLSATESLEVFNNTNHYLFRQLISVAIGLICLLIVYKIPLDTIKKFIPFLFFSNIVLMVLVFFPIIGVEFWGAKRWLNIGGKTFQPSEFLKITAILYIALLLSKNIRGSVKKGTSGTLKKTVESFKTSYIPFLLVLGVISVLLIMQKDMATLGIIVISLLAIYFLSGAPIWHTVLSLVIMISGAITFIILEPYRVKRFMVFLNPETDPLGIGFQLRQSLIAVGSGGIFGNGLGMSTQKFGFLPQAMSDSLFAIVGEELGLIGCTILIALFLGFIWLGFKIAKEADDSFSKFAVIGISTWIVVQAFINIMSSIGLFPLSGIPLPFFSYGGTHIIAELIACGIILNISKNG